MYMNDVIFQADPFSINFTEELYCAAERGILSDPNHTSSICNMEWIQCSKSNKQLVINDENFNLKPIICAGTILGSYNGVLKFINFLMDACKVRIDNDQGLLNVYVYNYLESKKILNYTESEILTLDQVDFNSLTINKNNQIVNKKGEIYVIIHQIDRCNLKFMKNLVKL